MLNNRKLSVDTFSLVFDLLEPMADQTFWEFADLEPEPGTIYVIGRKQVVENLPKLRAWAESNLYTVIFDGSAEGSWTLQEQIRQLGFEDLVLNKQILLLSGGSMPDRYPHLLHDHFFNVILGYEQNVSEMTRMPEIYQKKIKPYKFLFQNGRARPHRKYLWERFRQLGLLNSSLWTMLDGRPTIRDKTYTLVSGETNLMATTTPIQQLPPQYETVQYRNNHVAIDAPTRQFIKHDMFNNTWGEIYIQAEPYIDTYFGLITETVVAQPGSFRTEKIARSIAIGHPWICVANRGFYKDLRNLGFETFGTVIDESFDQIDNTQDRTDRIVEIVQDLCSQDLVKFLDACYSICKYNQQHLMEYRRQLRSDFPGRFTQFLNE